MLLRPPTAILAVALSGGGARVTSFAHAQARPLITAYAIDRATACAAAANRSCYRYEASDTHECGACLARYFPLDGACQTIANIATDADGALFRAARRFLPAYADPVVSAATRRQLLAAATEVIASWNSRVNAQKLFCVWL